MFKLNEKVVYPGHGVAFIESFVEKRIGQGTASFFKLKFLFKDMTILIPTDNLESNGVRKLSDEETIQRSLNELVVVPSKKIENLDLSPSGWNKRNKEYQARIQNGKLTEVAKIYRDLMLISFQKDLSFGEKNLLHMTEELLAQEILTVRNQDKSDVIQELRAPFKQFISVVDLDSQPLLPTL
jgi:CarD family transcriptional regulator